MIKIWRHIIGNLFRTVIVFIITGEYDDAVKGLKRAENDTSLETEVDNAPRKRKPPKRYIDSTSTDENEENNMLPKKKNPRKTKISRKLSESDDESESDTLPQVNSDVLNAVKENICYIYEVENKVREKAHKRQSDENTVRVRVLQEFPSNCRQGEQKQRQQKKIDHDQCKSNVKSNDKYEKQKKMDRNKQNFVSITMANKNSVKFTNSKTSSVLSPIKDKVISGKTSKIFNTPFLKTLNILIVHHFFNDTRNKEIRVKISHEIC